MTRLVLASFLLLTFSALASASTFETEDGVEIAYWSQGKGDPTLVFVHCWACDHEFWKHQVDAFATDHRVVTLDLAGHGLSTASRDAWSIAGLGADVAALVRHLKLDSVVLVGHSLGGPVCLEAAARLGEGVKGVIAVDTLHDAEQKMNEEQAQGMLNWMRQDWSGAMNQFVGFMFPEGHDPEIKQWVVDKGTAGDPETLLPIIGGFQGYDFSAAMQAIDVPLRAVNAAPRPPFGPETKPETNRKYVDFDFVTIEGVGHYLQLEKPEEFNAALRKFVEELTD